MQIALSWHGRLAREQAGITGGTPVPHSVPGYVIAVRLLIIAAVAAFAVPAALAAPEILKSEMTATASTWYANLDSEHPRNTIDNDLTWGWRSTWYSAT